MPTEPTVTARAAQHAVHQTLAAQRIEGWEPQPAHIQLRPVEWGDE